MLLDSADISNRRLKSNSLFIKLLSAIVAVVFGYFIYTVKQGNVTTLGLIFIIIACIIGAILSFIWGENIASYGDMVEKLRILRKIEEYLPYRAYNSSNELHNENKNKAVSKSEKCTSNFYLFIFIISALAALIYFVSLISFSW